MRLPLHTGTLGHEGKARVGVLPISTYEGHQDRHPFSRPETPAETFRGYNWADTRTFTALRLCLGASTF